MYALRNAEIIAMKEKYILAATCSPGRHRVENIARYVASLDDGGSRSRRQSRRQHHGEHDQQSNPGECVNEKAEEQRGRPAKGTCQVKNASRNGGDNP